MIIAQLDCYDCGLSADGQGDCENTAIVAAMKVHNHANFKVGIRCRIYDMTKGNFTIGLCDIGNNTFENVYYEPSN